MIDNLKTTKFNDEVLFAIDTIVKIDKKAIIGLKKMAKLNKRRRFRLCAHKDIEDSIHEMLIVHEKDCYVRPHMHVNKTESFHIIEGTVDVIIFDENGQIKDIIPMGDYGSGRKFFYRLPPSCYHTLLIQSDMLVFHEVTNGPFKQSDTVWASWSPNASDETAVSQYMEMMMSAVGRKGGYEND